MPGDKVTSMVKGRSPPVRTRKLELGYRGNSRATSSSPGNPK